MIWRIPTILTNGKPIKVKSQKQLTMEQEAAFNAFWEIYPRRDARQDAIKAWVQTKDVRPPMDELKRAVVAYTAFKKGKHVTLIALAGTWLRGRQWNDEGIKRFITEPKPDPKPIDPRQEKIMELEAQLKAMEELGTQKALEIAVKIRQELENL